MFTTVNNQDLSRHSQIITRHKWELATLLLILLLAGWLRLGWIGINSFSFDEARVSHMALRMARSGQVAMLGMPILCRYPKFPSGRLVVCPATCPHST